MRSAELEVIFVLSPNKAGDEMKKWKTFYQQGYEPREILLRLGMHEAVPPNPLAIANALGIDVFMARYSYACTSPGELRWTPEGEPQILLNVETPNLHRWTIAYLLGRLFTGELGAPAKASS